MLFFVPGYFSVARVVSVANYVLLFLWYPVYNHNVVQWVKLAA